LDKVINFDSTGIEITYMQKGIRTYVHISVDNVDNVDLKIKVLRNK